MFQILIGYVSDIDYGLVFQLHLSEHLCIPPSILTLRLFLPSAHSLRSFAMLRRSILTAVTPDHLFIILFVGAYYPYLLSSRF